MIKFEFKSIREPDFEVNPGRSITFVKVFYVDRITKNSVFYGEGYTIKSASEPFNKALGQKYALVDAMTKIARENRQVVWHYFGVYSKASARVMK